jgi:hypothetical protein
MGLRNYLKIGKIRPPVLICFDHLYSEYLSVKSDINDQDAKSFIDKLPAKKDDLSLSWNDLYYFELIIAKYQPVEKLRSKVIRLRYDYRSIAGQKEFDDYLASKPPDLQSPPEPTDSPHATQAQYEKLLREDLKDLLGRIYLAYAILPVKEEKLAQLTWFAAGLCLFSLVVLMGILAILFLVPAILEMNFKGDPGTQISAFLNSDKLSSLTIFVVVVAGAMGGFVSALQRIQSPPTEGDSVYNLSLLFHGSNSVFVAPIDGAIFATLLYLMFTAGILQGTFFPAIFTPGGNPDSSSLTVINRPEQQNSNTNDASAAQQTGVDANSKTTPTPVPKQITTKLLPDRGLNVFDFLARSGPGNGRDYALLIIWCFIAGFAERFVPDALDRLISKSNSAGSSRS